MIATFRTVSLLWHQFLHGTSPEASGIPRTEGEDEGQQIRKRKASLSYRGGEGPYESPSSIPPALRARTIRTATDEDLLQALRTLFGAGAEWKSAEQALCYRTICRLQGQQSVIYILPTGAGKSLLFYIPAVLENSGISIIIVLFLALIEDLLVRAYKLQIDAIQFQSGLRTGREGFPRAAQLVFVSADIAIIGEFASYVDTIATASLLVRIYIDECYTIITDSNYRIRLRELKSVRRFGQPLIFLTATLPPTFLAWFRTEALAENAEVIRVRTSKANCRYGVEVVSVRSGARPDEAVQSRTIARVRELGAEMYRQQKGVIYYRSREETRKLAAVLGCPCHYSGMSEDERQAARTSWSEGQEGQRWITATVGLGTGIDIEGITAIVHMGIPYGLIDFVQQVGRGGRRAGEVVHSVVIYNGQQNVRGLREAHGIIESTNILQMESYVSTKGCRRAILGAFLDGSDTESCTTVPGAVPCDNCERQQAVRFWDGGLWRAYGRTEGQKIQLLYRWLLEVEDSCSTVCWVFRAYRARSRGRAEGRCEKGGGKRGWCRLLVRKYGEADSTAYEAAQRAIRFEELSCCFRCKLPLNWCEERRLGGLRTGCTAEDRVLPIVLFVRKWEWAQRLVQRMFGIDIRDRTSYFHWLGRKQVFHGYQGTNMLLLWEAILWEAYEQGEFWERYK